MKRDLTILMAFKKELSLTTRVVRDKKKYTRKTKFKKALECSNQKTSYFPYFS